MLASLIGLGALGLRSGSAEGLRLLLLEPSDSIVDSNDGPPVGRADACESGVAGAPPVPVPGVSVSVSSEAWRGRPS